MAHILAYDDWVGFNFSLNTILFCVLVQHLLHQLWGSLPITCTIMLAIVEVFFQWFIISSIGEAGTTVTTISVLSLMLSHWLMMPLAAYSGFSSKSLHRSEIQEQAIESDSEDEYVRALSPLV
jgi:hypothetical protein